MDTITIKDIAKICGVGVATVSRALNDHPDINPQTRRRIMEVVDEYGFVPNNSARNLKITDSRTIAVLVKGMTNPFFMKMIGVMEEEIQAKRYSLEIRHVDEKTDEVEVALELVKEKKLRGIVFLGGLINHSTQKLEKIGIPFVLSTIPVSSDSTGNYSSVSVDDVAESRRIVDYLIKNDFCNPHQMVRDERKIKLRTEFFRQYLSKCKVFLINTVNKAEETQELIRKTLGIE